MDGCQRRAVYIRLPISGQIKTQMAFIQNSLENVEEKMEVEEGRDERGDERLEERQDEGSEERVEERGDERSEERIEGNEEWMEKKEEGNGEGESEEKKEKKNPTSFNINEAGPKIFKNRAAVSYKVEKSKQSKDYDVELNGLHNDASAFLEQQRSNYPHGMTVHLSSHVTFKVVKKGKEVDEQPLHITSKSLPVLAGDDVYDVIEAPITQLRQQTADAKLRGSGYVFDLFNYHTITICQYSPFASTGSYCPTPKWVNARKATLNVKNQDNFCFIYSILAHLYPAKNNPERPSNYFKYIETLNLKNMKFPVEKKDIRIFEKNNDISVNIYAFDADNSIVYPYLVSHDRNTKHVINLLRLDNNEQPHFILIKNLAKLTRSLFTKNTCKTKVCPYCLLHKENGEKFLKHLNLCQTFTPTAIVMPPAGASLKFKDYGKMMPQSFCIYYDFETAEVASQNVEREADIPITTPAKYRWVKTQRESRHVNSCGNCTPARPCIELKKNTSILAHLIPLGYSFVIHDLYGLEIFQTRKYFGIDASFHFVQALREDVIYISKLLHVNIPLIMTEEDEKRHRSILHCECCKMAFSLQNPPQKDHHHRTGRYRQTVSI